MKDTSELMVDLAYSAVLLDNDEVAHEVLKLEEEIDRLIYELYVHTMLAAEDPEDAKKLVTVLNIATATDEISNAAGDIANIVLHDIRLHPLVIEALQTGVERIAKLEVKSTSILVDKTLGELTLPIQVGSTVLAIRRGTKWIYNPDDDVAVKAGDIVIVRTTETGAATLREVAEGTRSEF